MFFAKEVFTAILEGLGLDDFLSKEEFCIDQVELIIWYSYYSLEPFTHAEVDLTYLYNATYSFTRAVGTISPVLRKCYVFSESNEEQWVLLA